MGERKFEREREETWLTDTSTQDPASAGAAAENKAIALELAVQIASIGGDPTVALQSGTFEPGQIGDPTGAGMFLNSYYWR